MKLTLAIGVGNAITGAAPATETTWLTAITEGLMAPFTLKDETASKEALTKRHVQAVALSYGLVGAVAGSVFTRRRLAADPIAEPIAGFLF